MTEKLVNCAIPLLKKVLSRVKEKKEIKNIIIKQLESRFSDADYTVIANDILDKISELQIDNGNITLDIIRNAIYPILKKHVPDIQDNDIVDFDIVDLILDPILFYIDENIASFLYLEDKITDISNEIKKIINKLNEEKTEELSTIDDFNETLKSKSKFTHYNLDFFYFEDRELTRITNDFYNERAGILAIEYRCREEAYYRVLATLGKSSFSDKVRLIEDKNQYNPLDFNGDEIYVIDPKADVQDLHNGYHFIVFIGSEYIVDPSNCYKHYQLPPMSRNKLREHLQNLQDKKIDVENIMEQTQGEFYALIEKLQLKVSNNFWGSCHDSKINKAINIFMLLGGWENNDYGFISSLLETFDLGSLEENLERLQDVNIYSSNPLIVKNYYFAYGNKRNSVVSLDLLWNSRKYKLSRKDVGMFSNWLEKIFSTGESISVYFKQNILKTCIHLCLLNNKKYRPEIEKKVFDLLNKYPQNFSRCYSLVAEINPEKYIGVNDSENEEYINGLEVILCDEAFAVEALNLLVNLWIKNKSINTFHVLEKALTAWYNVSALSFENIKSVLDSKGKGLVWDLIYKFFPKLSGGVVSSMHTYEIRPIYSHENREYIELYRYYIKYCLDIDFSFEYVSILLKNTYFLIFDLKYAESIFFPKLKSFIFSLTSDSEKYKIEYLLRLNTFEMHSPSLKQYYDKLNDLFIEVIDSIDYDNTNYKFLYLFSFDMYRFPDIGRSVFEDNKKYIEKIERNIKDNNLEIQNIEDICLLIETEVADDRIKDSSYKSIGCILFKYYKRDIDTVIDRFSQYKKLLEGYVYEYCSHGITIEELDSLLGKLKEHGLYETITDILEYNFDGNSLERIRDYEENIKKAFWNNYLVRESDVAKYGLDDAIESYIKYYDYEKQYDPKLLFSTLRDYSDYFTSENLFVILEKISLNNKGHFFSWYSFLNNVFEKVNNEFWGKEEFYPRLICIEYTFIGIENLYEESFFFKRWFNESPKIYLSILNKLYKHENDQELKTGLFLDKLSNSDLFSLDYHSHFKFGLNDEGIFCQEKGRSWLCKLYEGLKNQNQIGLYYHVVGMLFANIFYEYIQGKDLNEDACVVFEKILKEEDKEGNAESSFNSALFNLRGAHFVSSTNSYELAEKFKKLLSSFTKFKYPHLNKCLDHFYQMYTQEANELDEMEVNSINL